MKICVYAICKNESEWIERWLDNMSEADYIVVLDTGSTDNSFELLKNDRRVTKVEQKIITPWRFDIARNESMKLVPEDTDVYVCTDFDEIFEKGWADVLRENWLPEDTRCYYTYAWSHNEIGEPQDVFKYDKIHNKNYHWKFPVHEILFPNDPNQPENVLDAGDHIYLHHLQDLSKPRGNYFDLLKLSVKENPDNAHCRMLLAREYLLKEENEEAIKEYLACLDYEEIYQPINKLVLLETYGRLGDLYYWSMHDFEKSLYYFNQFIKLDNSYREPYFCLGEIYANEGMYSMAINMINEGLKQSKRHYDWVERKDFWIAKADELLLDIYFVLHDYDNAKMYAKNAYQHNPNNNKIAFKYITILENLLEMIEENNQEL